MFFRIKIRQDGLTEDGRTPKEAWQEHFAWCIKTAEDNSPDTPEIMDHMYKTCVTWIGRSENEKNMFAGDASLNAFMEIYKRPKGLWEKYCSSEQKEWLEKFDDRPNK